MVRSRRREHRARGERPRGMPREARERQGHRVDEVGGEYGTLGVRRSLPEGAST